MEYPDFKYLRYALETAACGSITKASQKLYIAQPNLSRAIGELESSLGFPLFIRTKRGVLLTPEGEKFLPEAEILLNKLQELTLLCRDDTDRNLRLSITPTSLFFQSVLSCSNGNRDFPIECKEHNSCVEFFRQVGSGLSDAGFLVFGKGMKDRLLAYMKEKGLTYHFLAESPVYAIFNCQNPSFSSCEDADALPWPDIKVILNTSYFEPIGLKGVDTFHLLPHIHEFISGYSRAGNLDMLTDMDNVVLLSCLMHSRILGRNHLRALPYKPDLTVYEYGYVTKEGCRPAPRLASTLEQVKEAVLGEFNNTMRVPTGCTSR